MKNRVLALLSFDAAGLVIAAVPAVAGGLLLAAAAGSQAMIATAALLLVAALVLALLSLRHVLHMREVHRRHPPPGRLVDVGGYRIHVLAEGEARGRPAVGWMAGSHGSGYAMHHLHRRLRTEARSILVDRPGTGWSDAGPFPRTTQREAEEIVRALDAAGEHGPFVLAGHSFGGLLVANIARRYPERVATLVLLDPTPLETIVFGPRLPALAGMMRTARRTLLRNLFGFYSDANAEASRQHAYYARVMATIERELGEARKVDALLDHGAKPWAAMVSIFEELSPEGIARDAWNMVVYDGDLADLPVVLVAPQDMVEFETVQSDEPTAEVAEARRRQRFFLRTRDRYLATSTRSRRVVPPAGTGHNYPYEAPDFVVDVVRECLGPVANAPRAESAGS